MPYLRNIDILQSDGYRIHNGGSIFRYNSFDTDPQLAAKSELFRWFLLIWNFIHM